MPHRQTILIGALGVVALLFAGDYGYRTWYAQPKQAIQGKQDASRKRIQELKVDVAQAEKLAERLVALQKRSLPGNVEIARGDYQRWMLELVDRAELKNARVNASPPANNKNVLYRMSFTLQAKGKLSQVTSFLHEFYATGYLQKIKALNLTPRSSGDMDLLLGVDVLILPQTASQGAPPPAGKLAFERLADYRWIPWRNIFGRGGFEQFANELELTGITMDTDGAYEAWLSNRANGQTTILKRGDSMSGELVRLEVESISAESLRCRVDGQLLQMSIGDTVATATSIDKEVVVKQ